MDDVVATLADQQAELSRLLESVDSDGWERASRCEGWTVADVALHLAQTNEMALASVQGRFPAFVAAMAAGMAPASTVDDGAAAMVARERGEPGPSVRDRWQASADAFMAALTAIDLHQRVAWVAGELSARTLAATRLAETWIHTGDVAFAFGAPPAGGDELRHIARLAWRTLPYAFARAGRPQAGPVAFHLRAPGGEQWDFVPDTEPATTITGDALDLCLVAAQRANASDTGLRGEGPDAAAVLELVRTYA
jgi:uncharacterized protein (TIGR03084 family)